MKKFFMFLGVLFFIIILAIIAIIIIKPYGINVLKIVPALTNKNPTSTYDHPYLTTEQESILETVGIDTTKIPTKITPNQAECATKILGEGRVKEIVSGDTPSATEIIKAKSCFDL